MDDNEARYLIDQFNKYSSWGGKIEEIQIILQASLIGVVAVLVASFSISAQVQIQLALVLMNSQNQQMVTTAISAMAELAQKAATIADLVVKTAAMALVVFVMSSVTIYLKRWDLSKRLSTLEEYRSKYKSLPDTITFRKIVKKPKEVRKLLEESEQEVARHGRL